MAVRKKRGRRSSPKEPAHWEPKGPRDLALLEWIKAHPEVIFWSDGKDYAPKIAARMAQETGVSEWFIYGRWIGGRLHILRQLAFADE